MQVTDDSPERNPIIDRPFNFLALCAMFLHEKRGLQPLTNVRKHMKQKILHAFDKVLLRKKAIVESVIDQLKNISNIEHSRLRSVFNFMVNLLSGLAAYSLKPK